MCKIQRDGYLKWQHTINLELGGKQKSSKQVQSLENAFIVADDLEIGLGRKIPLGLFGLLY